MVAINLRICAAAGCDFLFHHVLDFISHFLGYRISADFRLIDLVIASIRILDFLDDMRLDHLSAVCQGAVCLHHLERCYRNALPDGHGRHIDSTHFLRIEENARSLARKIDSGRFPKAEFLCIFRQYISAGQKPYMGKAGIDGEFQDINETDIAIGFIIPVPDGMAGCPDCPGIVPDTLRVICFGCQSSRCNDRLECRSWFVNIDNGTVLEFCFCRLVKVVRVIGRPVSKRKDSPCLRIHDDNDAAGCFGAYHSAVERSFCIELDILIDCQIHGSFIFSLVRSKSRLQNRISPGIGQKHLLALASADQVIQRHFKPVEPLVIETYKAQHIRCHRAIGIESAAFIEEAEAFPPFFLDQSLHFIGIFRIHQTLQPYEACFPRHGLRQV